MSDPFVVVGGDAAGLSAASKCRREDPDRDVVVFERGRWVSYAHCGTPYFVGGVVERLTDLLSLSPADIADRGIDLRRGHEVTAVDPDARTVTVRGPDGSFEQPYGDLLVATGASATTGPFDADLDGVFTLHGLDAAAAIDAFLAPPGEYDRDRLGDGPVDEARVDRAAALDPPDRAAIVGGGYVGVEIAEALVRRGVDVHLFQRGAHLLDPFGAAVGERAEATLEAEGVTVHTGTAVDGLVGDDRVEAVEYGDDRLPVGMATLGVGIRPNVELLADAGADLGPGDAALTDDYGRTSLPNVYAAGDVATARHAVTGEAAWVPLGLTANRAGRAVGATVAGDPTPVGSVVGTAAVKAFDLECGRAGLPDEAAARDAGFVPVAETVTASSRSGYYPGAVETTVTLVADEPTGRLLGGAIAGTDRAAVRVDTVATALDAGLTVPEVERLDLAYAPPFSPVWDPVLVAAKVLAGRLDEPGRGKI
jgi:NADPH-dependent 2,4-dienoyl-CoA reductase/sulfur reductase-like enzyme